MPIYSLLCRCRLQCVYDVSCQVDGGSDQDDATRGHVAADGRRNSHTLLSAGERHYFLRRFATRAMTIPAAPLAPLS